MEFFDVLKNRHSIRKFLDKKVETKKIGVILDSATKAPSAGGLQSYKIYTVKSEEAREALIVASEYQEHAGNAPLILVFCADMKRSETKYAERGSEFYSIQDATIAAAYAQLAATAEGLSSVWIGDFEPLEVARIVNAGSYEVPIAIITIGYPNEQPVAQPKRPIKEIVKEV